jgi:hypothetical protein
LRIAYLFRTEITEYTEDAFSFASASALALAFLYVFMPFPVILIFNFRHDLKVMLITERGYRSFVNSFLYGTAGFFFVKTIREAAGR